MLVFLSSPWRQYRPNSGTARLRLYLRGMALSAISDQHASPQKSPCNKTYYNPYNGHIWHTLRSL